MAKHFIKADPDKQLEKRLRAALGSILHTQTAVRAALDQAEGFMTEAELANSPSYCHLCQYDAQCEDIFQTLCREMSQEKQSEARVDPDVVDLSDLLQIMDKQIYKGLLRRGKIELVRTAPHAAVNANSLPTRYRQALDEFRRSGIAPSKNDAVQNT